MAVYTQGLEEWKQQRLTDLYSESGFINLAGLYWMVPGEHLIGSSNTSQLQFPEDMPQHLGSLFVTRDQVVFTANPGIQVEVDSVPAVGPTLVFDKDEGLALEMTWGTYKWFVIERAGNLGIRLKNLQHPALASKVKIDRFPPNLDWVVEASYRPYDVPRNLRIENVLGHVFDLNIPGKITFEKEGEMYTLEPLESDDRFFIIFSDATSGMDTYGSGRYMYADQPKKGNQILLDFNKAYNPPCAFTDFATCLIPPPENQLTLAIHAGEKDYHVN